LVVGWRSGQPLPPDAMWTSVCDDVANPPRGRTTGTQCPPQPSLEDAEPYSC